MNSMQLLACGTTSNIKDLNPTCMCAKYDATGRIEELISDALVTSDFAKMAVMNM